MNLKTFLLAVKFMKTFVSPVFKTSASLDVHVNGMVRKESFEGILNDIDLSDNKPFKVTDQARESRRV